MAKIETYILATQPLSFSDMLIGTEVGGPIPNATKNFSLGELYNLFASFPAVGNLQQTLDAGNTATQDIALTGNIQSSTIKPTYIIDGLNSTGVAGEYLIRSFSGISWGPIPPTSLQSVLDAGNTATQNIVLTGNITSTQIIPGNIKDGLGNLGTTGQILSKTSTGIRWVNNIIGAQDLQSVLNIGNTATQNIILDGYIKTNSIKDSANNEGTLNQILSVGEGGLVWINQPTFSQVNSDWNAVSGVAEILNKPTIPAAQVNSDWSAISGVAEILNKPTIPAAQVNSDWSAISGVAEILNKPTIPAAQVNSDWSATSGVAEILNKPTLSSGTVTSVGLTMPSAFSVANSPVTTSGTLAVTGAGTSSQYVRGDGQLANFPNNGGGGSSVNYYLNGSVNQGTFGGDTYYEMSKTPILGAGTNFTRTNGQGNGYIASFITDAGDPSLLNIPGGNWNVEFYFQASSGGGSPQFYAELYKVSSSNVFTLVASGSANPEGITNGTTVDQYFTSIPVPQTSLLITDRLAIRIYVITSGRTITLHTENGNICEVLTTFSTGLNALNGLTNQVQYLATGTSGTDFAISSATDTHTFNLPVASATNTGKLSNSDFVAFQQYRAGDISRAYQILGSSAKAMVLGASVINMSAAVTMTSQQIRFIPIYIPFTMTLTGVTWYQVTAGNYTANNYNGVGLYQYAGTGGTLLNLVANSTNDGNIWKATSGTWNSKAFASPYTALEGIYYVAVMYSSSPQTTAPAIGGIAAPLGGSGNVYPVNFTSGVKLFGTMNTQTSLPSPQQDMNNVAFASTAVTTPFIMVY